MNTLSRVTTGALFAALPALAGCSEFSTADSGKVVVRGKLLEGGKPFTVDLNKVLLPKGTAIPPGVMASDVVRVVFISSESREKFEATTDPDTGRFEVTGVDGRGLVPGRYRIAVTARVGFGPNAPDTFGGRFSPERSSIIRDVRAGEEILIELARAR
jgi:hypothetical protein